uniref:Uncharacterized protein n=1 Tax=Rhizophora mucronata TaxID=61149 RepID=A0A2P2NX05_RHIMU
MSFSEGYKIFYIFFYFFLFEGLKKKGKSLISSEYTVAYISDSDDFSFMLFGSIIFFIFF